MGVGQVSLPLFGAVFCLLQACSSTGITDKKVEVEDNVVHFKLDYPAKVSFTQIDESTTKTKGNILFTWTGTPPKEKIFPEKVAIPEKLVHSRMEIEQTWERGGDGDVRVNASFTNVETGADKDDEVRRLLKGARLRFKLDKDGNQSDFHFTAATKTSDQVGSLQGLMEESLKNLHLSVSGYTGLNGKSAKIGETLDIKDEVSIMNVKLAIDSKFTPLSWHTCGKRRCIRGKIESAMTTDLLSRAMDSFLQKLMEPIYKTLQNSKMEIKKMSRPDAIRSTGEVVIDPATLLVYASGNEQEISLETVMAIGDKEGKSTVTLTAASNSTVTSKAEFRYHD